MTGDGDISRLVVRIDTGLTVEDFVSPDGWRLQSPEPGEALSAFVDRAIIGDLFFQSILLRGSFGGLKPPALVQVRPAEWNLAKWEERCPEKVFSWIIDQTPLPEVLTYHLNRVALRLVVELLDRWETGDLVMKAHRKDDPEYPLEVVDPRLRRNPHMMLCLRDESFEPRHYRGRPSPPRLPSYCDVTLHSVSKVTIPTVTERLPTPDDPTEKREAWAARLKRQHGKDRVIAALDAWALEIGKVQQGSKKVLLPGRKKMLGVHRDTFGFIRGINEQTMAKVQRRLVATERAELTRGGASMHDKRLGK